MRAACALEDVAPARVAVVALGVDQRAAARAARERAREAWFSAAARHRRCCAAPLGAALGCAVGWRESHGGVWSGRTRHAAPLACCPLHTVQCSGCVRPLPRGAPVATNRSGRRDSRERSRPCRSTPCATPRSTPAKYPVDHARAARLSSAPLSSIESARQCFHANSWHRPGAVPAGSRNSSCRFRGHLQRSAAIDSFVAINGAPRRARSAAARRSAGAAPRHWRTGTVEASQLAPLQQAALQRCKATLRTPCTAARTKERRSPARTQHATRSLTRLQQTTGGRRQTTRETTGEMPTRNGQHAPGGWCRGSSAWAPLQPLQLAALQRTTTVGMQHATDNMGHAKASM